MTRPGLLEAARSLSARHHGVLVVCGDFLPWLDLAISADCIDPQGIEPAVRVLHWLHVSRFLHQVVEEQAHRQMSCRQLTPFGMIRCWHPDLRARALEVHQPVGVLLRCGWQDALASRPALSEAETGSTAALGATGSGGFVASARRGRGL